MDKRETLDEVVVFRVKSGTRLMLADLVIETGQSLSDLLRQWIAEKTKNRSFVDDR